MSEQFSDAADTPKAHNRHDLTSSINQSKRKTSDIQGRTPLSHEHKA
jgi:hypothetical protein